MNTIGTKSPVDIVSFINDNSDISWNLTPHELEQSTIELKMGQVTNTGALAIDTGKFTGRAPKDRFIVQDENTTKTIDWGKINQPINSANYTMLKNHIINYLKGKKIFGRNAYACADISQKLDITLITEHPWSNLFGYNMFLRPKELVKKNQTENNWTILCAPGLHVENPKGYGLNQSNFSILNFTEKVIIIAGTGYTGEIKKGIFSVLNYILPKQKNILPMHCSANIGNNNDTSLFFGLSGTGKTTLSADPNRRLIGDDEHGWSDKSIFNFEGGCYAKCINLSYEKEPDIFAAIKKGALLENISLKHNNEVDYSDASKTENTRVSYPIFHIKNIAKPSVGPLPKNIFFLTADAFGVLPPISKLNTNQTMYHFISGYTSKVAGTEEGVKEPEATFSACFGSPFMPLHPTFYAKMLGEKMKKENVNVWLINTGWSGGPYGIGSRIQLKYTRAMIHAAMTNQLENVQSLKHEIFGLIMPVSCPNVPEDILNPINTWKNKEEYKKEAVKLATLFHENFKSIELSVKNESNISKADLKDILLGSPNKI
ncbi:MAG: phosphoenolpyruvate carboxykinase (ATP) [Flavobacteriales bacterium]|nr:phosphoenolpyruvate carboxykinase (ATP) [Flavobacteriales bacterium]